MRSQSACADFLMICVNVQNRFIQTSHLHKCQRKKGKRRRDETRRDELDFDFSGFFFSFSRRSLLNESNGRTTIDDKMPSLLLLLLLSNGKSRWLFHSSDTRVDNNISVSSPGINCSFVVSNSPLTSLAINTFNSHSVYDENIRARRRRRRRNDALSGDTAARLRIIYVDGGERLETNVSLFERHYLAWGNKGTSKISRLIY